MFTRKLFIYYILLIGIFVTFSSAQQVGGVVVEQCGIDIACWLEKVYLAILNPMNIVYFIQESVSTNLAAIIFGGATFLFLLLAQYGGIDVIGYIFSFVTWLIDLFVTIFSYTMQSEQNLISVAITFVVVMAYILLS